MPSNKTMPLAKTPSQGRVCWFCVHVRFYSGSPGYSEYTPGENMELYCSKNYWEFRQCHDSLEEFRGKLMSAERCADFNKAQE